MATTDKWRLSPHAVKRVVERAGIPREQARKWVNEQMDQATYLCEGMAEDGNRSRMYAYKGFIFCAAPGEDLILTVMDAEVQPTAMPKIVDNALKDIRKSERKMYVTECELIALKASIECELAERKLAKARARSEAKKMALTGRINALELRLREIKAEIKQTRRGLTKMAYTIAALAI